MIDMARPEAAFAMQIVREASQLAQRLVPPYLQEALVVDVSDDQLRLQVAAAGHDFAVLEDYNRIPKVVTRRPVLDDLFLVSMPEF